MSLVVTVTLWDKSQDVSGTKVNDDVLMFGPMLVVAYSKQLHSHSLSICAAMSQDSCVCYGQDEMVHKKLRSMPSG